MKPTLQYLSDRMKEPSTHAAIVGMAAIFLGDSIKADAIMQAMTAALGLLAVFRKG